MYPSKIGIYQKKKCHLLPSKTFCWDTSPPKNTQKFLPPTLPRPTLLPGSLPLPPYGLSNRVPRTQFPRPNELPGKDLPRMNFPTKNAAKPPKKHNKNSKIHGFVRQNFSDFFFRNFHNVSKEILHDKKLLQRIRNSYLPRWSNFPQFVRPKLFRWSQGKDGFEQHRRQSRFQPNLLIPKFMLGFCGSKISGTFFGHQGFSSIHQKKTQKKISATNLGISHPDFDARHTIGSDFYFLFHLSGFWPRKYGRLSQSSPKNGLHHAKVPKNPTRDCLKNWQPQKGRRWLWQRAPSLKMIFDGFWWGLFTLLSLPSMGTITYPHLRN